MHVNKSSEIIAVDWLEINCVLNNYNDQPSVI